MGFRRFSPVMFLFTGLMTGALLIAFALVVNMDWIVASLAIGTGLIIIVLMVVLFWLIASQYPRGAKRSSFYSWLFLGSRTREWSPWYSVRADSAWNWELDDMSMAKDLEVHEQALYYSRPPDLAHLDEAKKGMERRRRIEKVEVDEGERKYGKGVLKCPQCDTPFVFDSDQKHCHGCGTKLHDGKKLLFETKVEVN